VIVSFGLEGMGDYATMLVGNCGYLHFLEPNRRLFIMEHVPTLKASKYALISISKNGLFFVYVQYYTPLSFQMVYPLVVICSILALLLFTILNLVTAGYVLR
jgi:hypothetical protein